MTPTHKVMKMGVGSSLILSPGLLISEDGVWPRDMVSLLECGCGEEGDKEGKDVYQSDGNRENLRLALPC